MDLKTKLAYLRGRKEWKCNVKWEVLKEHDATWKTNGLHDLKYARKGPARTLVDAPCCCATVHTVDVQLNGHWSDDQTQQV